jgi:AcrR family transcriptional regulator
MIATVPAELPMLQPDAGSSERADAARNRARIMEAAEALVAERGIENVSMHDVAAAAAVGTGTLYRRFGDRSGLAYALLDDHTRRFQQSLISGPPPLGPGAPAAERLRAFGEGYIDLLERHSDLLVAAGASERDGRGPYTLYATHLAILIAEAAPALDAPLTARWLLATLGPGHYVHARRALGWEVERLKAGWAAMTAALCATRS